MAPDEVRAAFKFVAGVLNGAFDESAIADYMPVTSKDLSFLAVVDTLANAIGRNQIPAQGLTVLTDLSRNMEAHGLMPGSSLHRALGLSMDCNSLDGMAEGKDTEGKDTDGLQSLEVAETLLESQSSHTRTSDNDIDSTADPLDVREEGGCAGAPLGERRQREEPLAELLPKDEETHPVGTEARKPQPSTANILFRAVLGDKNGVTTCSFDQSCDQLAAFISGGQVPKAGRDALNKYRGCDSSAFVVQGALAEALDSFLCSQCVEVEPVKQSCACRGSTQVPCKNCSGSGRFRPACRACEGTGKGWTKSYCPVCSGQGKKDVGACRSCQGSGKSSCTACHDGRPLCSVCQEEAHHRAIQQQQQHQQRGQMQARPTGPPKAGVSVERCSKADLTRLQNLWMDRHGDGEVVEAWKVDNPLLVHEFNQRRNELKAVLKREADKLEGFHGTHPDNILSICATGFSKGKRSGQVFGAGEYFANNPNVSVGYARGGEYMLVCRLTFGIQSSTMQNLDGDHIWVPSQGYYVIKEPTQVLPQFIVKFSSGRGYTSPPVNPGLEKALADGYSTKAKEEFKPVMHQRPCLMSRDYASVLWMGFFHGNFSDETLAKDVRSFFERYAPGHIDRMKIQIVKGHYKKAHVVLERHIPRELVHSLNRKQFVEAGKPRSVGVCIDDAHGSPEQRCPKFIAGYCRGQTLRFTQPCWCKHEARPTANASYHLSPVELTSAKGCEILSKFEASGPFHNGAPCVLGVKAIKNDVLSRCHEEYRKYLITKHEEEPALQELYHGTNNNILDTLYTHGLQPPSDMQPGADCPISGGKGLCTSLCDNTCRYCTKKHEWNKCHMYGLGIYLADMAQKSHRYTSQPKLGRQGRHVYRMLVCSVLGKGFQVEGHLKGDRAMHDVANVRALTQDLLDDMIEPCRACKSGAGLGAHIVGADGEVWGRVVAEERCSWKLHTGRIARKETEGCKWKWSEEAEVAADSLETSAEKSDLLYVKGLGGNSRPGFSVINSEYIAFHPHQCLPLYEIEYEIR